MSAEVDGAGAGETEPAPLSAEIIVARIAAAHKQGLLRRRHALRMELAAVEEELRTYGEIGI